MAIVSPRPHGMLAYLRAGTLAIWFFTLVLHFWWISDWNALVESLMEGNTKEYFYLGFGIAIAAHLTLGLEAWLVAPFNVVSTWSGRLLTAFCLLMLILSPLSEVPKVSALYSVATWIVLLIFCLYWQSDYQIVRRMTVFAGIVVLTWIYILLFKHGLIRGFGSAIGGINRNTTSFAAIGGMVCVMLSPNKRLRWAAIGAALLLAVLVTSRGSIVAAGAFITAYYAVTKGSMKTVMHGLFAMLIVGAVFLVSPSLRHHVLDDVMQLHKQARGLGSGFTGRTELWQQAIDAFWQRPLIGYGFRASTSGIESLGGVHSGFLHVFLDGGFIGGFLVLSAIIIELMCRFRLSVQFRSLPPIRAPGIDVVETTRVNAVAFATLAMTLVIWIYEQLYINLGSVASLTFFLMMAAPAYITTQGIGLRR